MENALSAILASGIVALAGYLSFFAPDSDVGTTAPPVSRVLAPSASVAPNGGVGLPKEAAPGKDVAVAVRPPMVATALPDHPPATVRFGMVLVTYDGAQDAPTTGARSKASAMTLAEQISVLGQSDFHEAVLKGDSGSFDDVGRVALGDLPKAAEAALFSLPVGGVSGVVSTPRGFLVFKRSE